MIPKAGKLIVAPGAFDAMTATLVEQAGFPAVYVTGSGVSISVTGKADLGLVSFKELRNRVEQIVEAVSIPVIVDADTGFGGVLNVIRTIRELGRSGAWAIQLEDQLMPKRCGHEPGRRIAPAEEMCTRIRAAAENNPNGVRIIARTDARTEFGIEEAIRRVRRYREAGADILFVESPESVDEMKRIHREIDAPTLCNQVEGGRTPLLPVKELEQIGYDIVIFPNALTRIMVPAAERVLREIQTEGTTRRLLPEMIDHHQLFARFRYYEMEAVEKRYAGKQEEIS